MGLLYSLSGNLGDVLGKFALEVGCFVLGDTVFRSETVEHGANFAVACFCGCFVGHLAEIANCVAGCLGIVAVVQTAACCLTDALLRRIVVCHFML